MKGVKAILNQARKVISKEQEQQRVFIFRKEVIDGQLTVYWKF